MSSYVIQIGHVGTRPAYYKADDEEPTVKKKEARRYDSREEAEVEAQTVRETWNLKPFKGPITKVSVVEVHYS